MNWHIGQKVVCIHRGAWGNTDTLESATGPRYNDILIIRSINVYGEDCYLEFIEYPDPDICFLSTAFRPLESTYTEEEIEAVNIDELVQPEMEPA